MLHWSLSSTCLSADDVTLNRHFWLCELCEDRQQKWISRNAQYEAMGMQKNKIALKRAVFCSTEGIQEGKWNPKCGSHKFHVLSLHGGKRALCLGFYCPWFVLLIPAEEAVEIAGTRRDFEMNGVFQSMLAKCHSDPSCLTLKPSNWAKGQCWGRTMN